MIRYEKPDGTSFTLAYHRAAQWATKVESQLRALGCSDEYAKRVAQGYARAVIQ